MITILLDESVLGMFSKTVIKFKNNNIRLSSENIYKLNDLSLSPIAISAYSFNNLLHDKLGNYIVFYDILV